MKFFKDNPVIAYIVETLIRIFICLCFVVFGNLWLSGSYIVALFFSVVGWGLVDVLFIYRKYRKER